jgi:hypothetical protein
MGRVAAVSGLSGIFVNFGTLFITLLTTLVGYYIVTNVSPFKE